METKLTVLIPTWSGTQELTDMALELCQYVRPQCDELIISEDSRFFRQELFDVCDIYISHPNYGDIVNVCQAAKLFTGDFLAHIQTDIVIHQGNIRDLCIPGKVVTPLDRRIAYHKGFVGAFFVTPRSIIEEFGYLNPNQDSREFGERVKENFLWSDAVEMTHLTGVSYHARRKLQEARDRGESLPSATIRSN